MPRFSQIFLFCSSLRHVKKFYIQCAGNVFACTVPTSRRTPKMSTSSLHDFKKGQLSFEDMGLNESLKGSRLALELFSY
jgi:hypothetical protein